MLLKRTKGFTLLESMLVLTIAGITATMAVQQANMKFHRRLASITGKQIRQIGKATDAYITHNYSDWPMKKGKNASSLSYNQAGGPRQCYSDDTCTISIKTLVKNGYLPNWNPNLKNPLRSPYNIVIKKSSLSNSTMPLISSLVVTQQPYTPTGNPKNINYAMLGRAVQAAGSQAGYSRNMGNCTATSICGYGGSFRVSGKNFHNVVNQQGQLGYYTSISQGFLNNQYLRRDGTLPMYGDLYMGEHNIYNVHQIQGTSKQNIGQKHELSTNNTPTKNEISTMRMGNIMVSTNPKKLPKVNANPRFATAANVPTLLQGNVSITANKTVISKDNKPKDNNFIAVFRKNPNNTQTAFAIGSKAKTTYHNTSKNSITMKGGIHFTNSNKNQTITNGTDGLNATSNANYDNNNAYFSNYTGISPVNVMDSFSVAGMITNKARYGTHDGVNIVDNNYIDLTAHNSSAYGQLQKPQQISHKLSQGWVNVGGNNKYNTNQTGVAVKNGPVFVGGSSSCNYKNATANQQCQSDSAQYPKSGDISANDYYIRNYGQPNKPLSKILSQRIAIKGLYNVRNGTVVPKPTCSKGTPHAVDALSQGGSNKAYTGVTLQSVVGGFKLVKVGHSYYGRTGLVITYCN